MTRALVAAALALLVVACDDRQAFHEPNPTLARMLDQRRVDPYEQPMRAPPPGTVATDDDADDAPPDTTRALVELGRARFEAVCATCHGILGDGRSVVAEKMQHKKPPSLLEERIRRQSREQVFSVATNGYGLMPGFADLLDTRERWAVAAYVNALQISQAARVSELPQALRDELAKEAR